MKKLYTLIVLCLFITTFSTAGEKVNESPEIKKAKSADNPINTLIRKGWNYQQVYNNLKAADSVLGKAINLSQMTYDQGVILNSLNAYLECMDVGIYNKKRLALLPETERLVSSTNNLELASVTYSNIADVHRSVYNFDKALEYSYRSFNAAELSGKIDLKAESYISIGKSMEGKNQLLEAFRNYLQAMNIGENEKNHVILDHSYKSLSRFYNLSKDYNNAIKFKLKQIELLNNKIPSDSISHMWLQFELEEISYNSMKTLNEVNMDRLLSFATRHNKPKLREFTLTLYRSYLIYTEQLDKLKKFYFEKYPHELQKLERENPAMHHRIMALILEKEGKSEEAFKHWIDSEKIVANDPNKVFKANFYLRFGQFLNRRNKTTEAVAKFENALQLATEAGYINFSLNASEELESSYVKLADYKNAYKFSRMHLLLTDSLASITKKDDLLKLEIENTTRQREENLKKEELETERKHNLQYTAIVIIMGIIFVVLLTLGSIKVPKWSIQMLGFVSFILLFEFIILIADQKIHHATHGEPWKILALKIVLIGILMPLHHWTEKKVIHYLIHKKVVAFKDISIRQFLRELFIHEKITP